MIIAVRQLAGDVGHGHVLAKGATVAETRGKLTHPWGPDVAFWDIADGASVEIGALVGLDPPPGEDTPVPPNAAVTHAIDAGDGRLWLVIPPDSVDGRDRKPDRYTGPEGRETIDVMRDMALAVAAHSLGAASVSEVRRLADSLFAYHCRATALKYQHRDGKKGDTEGDNRKASWYEAMALHAEGRGPDPRSERPGFEPYKPPPLAEPAPPPVDPDGWVRVHWSPDYLDFERPADVAHRWSVSVSRYGSFSARLAYLVNEGGGPIVASVELGPNDDWTDADLSRAVKSWADDQIASGELGLTT